MPGIAAGALLAFTLSIDDFFVITFFVAGPGATTLPIYVYGMIKFGSPSATLLMHFLHHACCDVSDRLAYSSFFRRKVYLMRGLLFILILFLSGCSSAGPELHVDAWGDFLVQKSLRDLKKNINVK